MEKINMEIYKRDIEEKNLNNIYNDILFKFFVLTEIIIEEMDLEFKEITKKINKIKNSPKEKLIEKTLDEIKEEFEENVASFGEVINLARDLKKWEDGRGLSCFLLSPKIVLENYVSSYNNIVSELNKYKETIERLKIENYEDIKNEEEEKLILLFKEMMDYKNKEYSEEWNFEQWIKQIGENYKYYHKILEQTLNQIERNILVREGDNYQEYNIESNEIDNIMALENLYNKLTNPDYKKIEEEIKEEQEEESKGTKAISDLYNTIADTYNEEEEYLEFIDKEDAEEDLFSKPISKEDALCIASMDNNLKSDFCRAKKYGYTYISFDDADIELIELKGKNYWQVQIKSGELSGIDYYKRDIIDWDGDIGEKDLPYLRCLIEIETGKYIYYPTKKRRKFISKEMR